MSRQHQSFNPNEQDNHDACDNRDRDQLRARATRNVVTNWAPGLAMTPNDSWVDAQGAIGYQSEHRQDFMIDCHRRSAPENWRRSPFERDANESLVRLLSDRQKLDE
jgi:hypothetical protein